MKTHITFVLDSSGSMSKIEEETRKGYNEMLNDQAEEEGTAKVTLYDFNTGVEQVYHAKPIDVAPVLTEEDYTPDGRTALHDAITIAIQDTREVVEDSMIDNVVVVVLTDGKENASETSQERVRELVTGRQDEGWEFLFIGANQDAALTAEQMGMKAKKSLSISHSGEGVKEASKSTSEALSNFRHSGIIDGFDEQDRQRQREADDGR